MDPSTIPGPTGPAGSPGTPSGPRDPSWDDAELEGSHWLMFSHPAEVAGIILSS